MYKVVHINTNRGKVDISRPTKKEVIFDFQDVKIFGKKQFTVKFNEDEILQALILACQDVPYPRREDNKNG